MMRDIWPAIEFTPLPLILELRELELGFALQAPWCCGKFYSILGDVEREGDISRNRWILVVHWLVYKAR